MSELEANGLRILISQNVGLKYAIPIALEKLENNILEEAFFYPGDLLVSLLNTDSNFWMKDGRIKNRFISLLNGSENNIVEQFDNEDEVDQDILKLIQKFLSTY